MAEFGRFGWEDLTTLQGMDTEELTFFGRPDDAEVVKVLTECGLLGPGASSKPTKKQRAAASSELSELVDGSGDFDPRSVHPVLMQVPIVDHVPIRELRANLQREIKNAASYQIAVRVLLADGAIADLDEDDLFKVLLDTAGDPHDTFESETKVGKSKDASRLARKAISEFTKRERQRQEHLLEIASTGKFFADKPVSIEARAAIFSGFWAAAKIDEIHFFRAFDVMGKMIKAASPDEIQEVLAIVEANDFAYYTRELDFSRTGRYQIDLQEVARVLQQLVRSTDAGRPTDLAQTRRTHNLHGAVTRATAAPSLSA